MSILTSLDWTRFSFDVLCIEDQVCKRCGEREVRRERWRERERAGVGEGNKGAANAAQLIHRRQS
jgi:hypothetical protein